MSDEREPWDASGAPYTKEYMDRMRSLVTAQMREKGAPFGGTNSILSGVAEVWRNAFIAGTDPRGGAVDTDRYAEDLLTASVDRFQEQLHEQYGSLRRATLDATMLHLAHTLERDADLEQELTVLGRLWKRLRGGDPLLINMWLLFGIGDGFAEELAGYVEQTQRHAREVARGCAGCGGQGWFCTVCDEACGLVAHVECGSEQQRSPCALCQDAEVGVRGVSYASEFGSNMGVVSRVSSWSHTPLPFRHMD